MDPWLCLRDASLSRLFLLPLGAKDAPALGFRCFLGAVAPWLYRGRKRDRGGEAELETVKSAWYSQVYRGLFSEVCFFLGIFSEVLYWHSVEKKGYSCNSVHFLFYFWGRERTWVFIYQATKPHESPRYNPEQNGKYKTHWVQTRSS